MRPLIPGLHSHQGPPDANRNTERRRDLAGHQHMEQPHHFAPLIENRSTTVTHPVFPASS